MEFIEKHFSEILWFVGIMWTITMLFRSLRVGNSLDKLSNAIVEASVEIRDGLYNQEVTHKLDADVFSQLNVKVREKVREATK